MRYHMPIDKITDGCVWSGTKIESRVRKRQSNICSSSYCHSHTIWLCIWVYMVLMSICTRTNTISFHSLQFDELASGISKQPAKLIKLSQPGKTSSHQKSFFTNKIRWFFFHFNVDYSNKIVAIHQFSHILQTKFTVIENSCVVGAQWCIETMSECFLAYILLFDII